MNDNATIVSLEPQQKPENFYLLEGIDQKEQVEERLQMFNHETFELWFSCGDGDKSIFISSKGELKPSKKPFRTKLSPETVGKFLDANGSKIVDGIALLKNLQDVLRKYLYFRDERVYLFNALWIVGTYLYSLFSHWGYFFIHSRTPRRGKTRVLEISCHLAYEADVPLNGPTPASLRDLATAGGSLHLDTIERWRQKSPESYGALMELLDAGFRTGGKTAKQVLVDNEWSLKSFPVFAPFMFAGINKNSLSETAIDRSFVIPARKKPLKKLDRYIPADFEKKFKHVRDDLYVWSLENTTAAATVYRDDEFDSQVNELRLNDRAADIWKPIFTVLKSLGFDSNSDEWADLSSFAVEMHKDKEVIEVERKLSILSALEEMDPPFGMTNELLDHLHEQGVEIDQHELSKSLDSWGFKKKSKRVNGDPRKCWDLSKETLIRLKKELQEYMSPPKIET